MSILFKNVNLVESYGYEGTVNVLVEKEKIAYVGKELSERSADRIIEGNGNLLLPGFYNAHCHSAMTLFRGYGDDLPLKRWLNEKILPAEDRLNPERVEIGTRLAIAEMIKNGVVSFSDMYFFVDSTAKAVAESGMKANLSRCIVSFDPDADFTKDPRVIEAMDVFEKWNNSYGGRIKVDMSLHAEYTNVPRCARYVGRLARELGVGMQVHISETRAEHEECIARHGKTPIKFFLDCGVLDMPVAAAHCVHVTDEDIAIMAERGVTAVHNPVSNLKLGSGVMPYKKMLDAGVNVALGTDGVASNNRLSILRELQYAALIHKGVNYDAAVTSAGDLIKAATRNGAIAQGRLDSGEIKVGMKADLVLLDMNSINNIPSYNFESTVAYSAAESDVLMTVCDGRILYDHGTYTSLDEELLRHDAKRVISHYFD